MRKLILLALSSCILKCGFCADNHSDSLILSFKEALLLTLEQSFKLEAIEHEATVAQFQRKAAFGLRSPTLSLDGFYTYMGDDIEVNLNDLKQDIQPFVSNLPPPINTQIASLFAADWGGLSLQDRSFGVLGATATLPLYLGGRINAVNRVAKLEENMVVERGNQAKNSVISEIVKSYYGLVFFRHIQAVREQVVSGLEAHLYSAIQLEKNGIISKGDRLFVVTKLANARRELQVTRLELGTIQSVLNTQLNEKVIVTPLSTLFILETLQPIAVYRELVLEHSPFLKEVSIQKRIVGEAVKIERANFLPEIVGMGSYNIYDYQLSSMIPDWVVGVGVNLKLFNGLSREFKYRASKARALQVESLRKEVQQDILIEIEKLYNELEGQRDYLPYVEAAMISAKEYLRIQKEGFAEGISSAMAVVDAELELAKVRAERFEIAYKHCLTLARFLEVVGISGDFVSYSNSVSAVEVKFE